MSDRPAFPSSLVSKNGPDILQTGVSVRELFAAVAMHAAITRGHGGLHDIVGYSRAMADAMMEALNPIGSGAKE